METLILKEPEKLFFTSDPHYGHDNIIKFCNRPFVDSREMNDILINNWNNVITEDSLVFILGDFTMWKKQAWENILNRLTGRKIFIKGNHDKDKNIPLDKFELVVDGFINTRVIDPEAKGGEQRITMCHYPMLSWYQSHRGAWQLFGHMHNNTIMPNPKTLNNPEVADFMKQQFHYMTYIRADQYDCGVDGNNFTPISYFQVKKLISQKLDLKKQG